MQKTPSYLKGLAETRARAAADVLRYQQVADEVLASLARAKAEVDACDRLIRKFDNRLDPTQIEPVEHWKGRYGKRGALKEAVLALLAERAPEAISTTEIGWQMQLTFDIRFAHWKERKHWMANSLASCLTKLAKAGLIETGPDPHLPGGPKSWRVTNTLPR